MEVIQVRALDDPRLADYASLGDERRLSARGLFVAEGRFVVRRLLEGGQHVVRSVLVNEAAFAALAPLLSRLAAPIYVCEPRFFEGLTGHHFHRGCLALAERPVLPAPLALAAQAESLVVLDRVADPDNVGSVFRSALGLGVGGVWLGPGCADPLSRKAVRTSMAATLRLGHAVHEAAPERATSPRSDAAERASAWVARVAELRGLGFELLALSPREPATPLHAFVPERGAGRFALLVGAEGEGLRPELEALAARRLQIVMKNDVDSLNLGVATAVALHWLTRAGG